MSEIKVRKLGYIKVSKTRSTKVSEARNIKVSKTHLIASQEIVEMSDDDVNQNADIVVIEKFCSLFFGEDFKEQFVDSVNSVDEKKSFRNDGRIFFPVQMRDKVFSELTCIRSERKSLDDETV